MSTEEELIRADILTIEAEVARVELTTDGHYSVMLRYSTISKDDHNVSLNFDDDGDVLRELHVGDKLFICLEARS